MEKISKFTLLINKWEDGNFSIEEIDFFSLSDLLKKVGELDANPNFNFYRIYFNGNEEEEFEKYGEKVSPFNQELKGELTFISHKMRHLIFGD